jgi:MFS family permease
VLRHTAHPNGTRYGVLCLFTISMVAASALAIAIGTLLPYIADAFPEHRAHMAVLVTAVLLGASLMTVFSGIATDRFGDKAMLLFWGAVMGLSLIGAALLPSFSWLAFCFVLYGFGFGAINPIGSHAMLFFFKPEERGFAMGVRQTGMPLGGVCGALIFAGVSEHWGYRGALLAAGVLLWGITWISAALYREPDELHGKPVRATLLLKDVARIGREPRLVLITIVCGILFAAQVALMGFFPLTLVREAHLSASFAAMVFIIAQVAAIAGRLLWGWLSDRVFRGNRILPLAINCVLCALAALAVAHVAQLPAQVLAAIAFALGFSAEGWFGLAVVAMAEVGGAEHAGSAMGFGLTWVFGGGVVAPALFSLIMENAGIATAWHALALLSLAGVVPAIAALMLRRRSLEALG